MPFLLKSSTSGSRGHSIHAPLFVMLVALCLGLSACGGGGGGGDGDGFGGGPTVHDDHGDWLTSATRVAPDSNTYGVLTAGDEDWFEIPLNREGTLLVYTTGGTDTQGQLYDEFQRVVSEDGDGGSGLNFQIETSVRDLTHYVRVRGHGGSASGPYTLHVRFTPASTPGDIHGDTRQTATPIAPGSVTAGMLTRGDEDWFRFTVDVAGRLDAHTTGNHDTSGRLYDANGRLLDDYCCGGPNRNFRMIRHITAGTYYIRVIADFEGRQPDYTLNVNFTPGGADHGDSRQSASLVATGSDTDSLLTSGDVDYFRVVLDRPGELTVYTSRGTDTVGRLEDSGGSVLASDDNGGSGNNFRIVRDVAAGTYYVRVTSGPRIGTSSGLYTLHVRFTPASTVDDHGERPSDATAVTTASDTLGELTAGDEDWFRIVVDRPGRLTVYTSGSTDTFGELKDAHLRPLAFNDNGGNGSNFRIEHDVSAGTYYVEVQGRTRNTTGSYTLHVRFTPAGTPTVDDHGERPSDATVVTTTSDTRGELTAGDVDWFRIVVDRPGRLTVYSSGSTDTVGRLRDSRQGLLASSNDEGSGNNFRIEHDVTAGTYYVEVRGRISASTAGPYTLHVRFNATPSDQHGNTCAAGTAIDLGSTTSIEVQRDGELTLPDIDYFRVTVGAGRLRAFTSGTTDTVGRLESTGGTRLTSDDDGGSGNNFLIEHDVSAGTYCVRVNLAPRSSSGPYTLHLRLDATPSGDDHGDTCTGGTAVDLGSTTNIELQRDGELTAGDTDYFRVTVGAGRLRAFTSGNTDTVGRVEDTGGTTLASDDNSGSGSNFQIEQSVSGGTYCVRVTGAGGSTGPYTLHLRLLEEIIVGMSGDVRVNIAWSADVDLDLHVTDPCGNTLGYAGQGAPRIRVCQSFVGEWDHDDQGDGYAQDNPHGENIVWTNGAPAGRYTVEVNYFNGSLSASYTVRVFYGSQQRTYTGRLSRANDHQIRRHVATFNFAGSSSSHGADASRFERGSEALSQAARSLGMSAVTAMSSRGQSQGGSSLTLAGQHVSFGNGATSPKSPFDDLSFTGKEPDWTERDDSERSGSWGEFLRGSRFDVALDEETRVWGEAHGIRGSNESRFLGFERSFGEGVSAGVAFSDTANEGNFGLAESESLEASLASAYQYLHLSPGASTELWSLVGTGQGELSLTDDIGTVSTDLSMQMLAFGSSHGLGPLIAGFAPTVSADGFLVRLESERRAGLRPLAGEASRLRTGVLFERPFEGDGWTPRIGFGVRHEDDERGVATRSEIMAGFGYVLDRLRVDGMAYLSPTGSGFAEPAGAGVRTPDSGARLTADYRAAPDGQGLAVSVDALAGSVPDAPVWKTDEVTGDSTSVHLQAGYGFASGPGRWMPYGEIRLDGDEQHLREGVRQDIGAVSLDLYGEHRLGATSEHGLHVGVTARY